MESQVAIRQIIRMGHPILRQQAKAVPLGQINSPWFETLMTDMQDTLKASGGIGLAAPQIGESYSVVLIDIKGGSTRYGELQPMPLTAYINPEIEILDNSLQGFYEGCLSVPGLRGYVERPSRIKIKFYDSQKQAKVAEHQDFLATVFQHEFDHLCGRLYIDRMTDTTKLTFEDEFVQFWASA